MNLAKANCLIVQTITLPCGLGMMGVLGPGCDGGQPIGPYPPGDIPG